MPTIEPFKPHEFSPDEHTVAQVLARAVERYGEKTFVKSVHGRAYTYEAFDRESNRLAHGFAEFGLAFQQPVLYMLPDTLDIALVWAAFAKRGVIGVPINLAYRGNFLARIINDSCAETIIVAEEFLPRLEEIAGELRSLTCCIIYREDDSTTGGYELPASLAALRGVHFASFFSDRDDAFEKGPSIEDLIAIMYTSGTTGASKGVMVTHAHAFCYAQGCGQIHGVVESDVYYTSGLPLFHIAGQWGVVYCSMIYGATACIRQGYRNEYFWPDIHQHGATVVFLLGAIANFIWQQPAKDTDANSPLQKVGMFPVIPEHAQFAQRFDVKISTGYGSTENPGGFVHRFDEPFPTNQCVGRPHDNVQACILDEFDRECATGVVGEICVRHDTPWTIMRGYWNQPEATAKAFRNLWFHTGDAGYKDAQGRFYFVDRLGDSMRRRGENVSSMEVEGEINQYDSVLECAVFPVWDEHTEQEIMAVIVAKQDEVVVPEQLVEFLNARLPYFMIPRYLEIVEAIEKTPTGKIRKQPLRERGVTDNTWDRVAAGIKLQR